MRTGNTGSDEILSKWKQLGRTASNAARAKWAALLMQRGFEGPRGSISYPTTASSRKGKESSSVPSKPRIAI